MRVEVGDGVPTLASTVTPSVIPTQTSAPTIPTSPDVPFSQIKWHIMIVAIAIAIVASAIIVSAVYYHYHRMQREKRRN